MANEQNYVEMSGPKLLDACADSALRWAEAFCQIKKASGWTLEEIDEGLMMVWFANAIESAYDHRMRR